MHESNVVNKEVFLTAVSHYLIKVSLAHNCQVPLSEVVPDLLTSHLTDCN